jgi:predicted nucleic acid-binding protein
MLKLLIDTCVWLDIAKSPDQQKLLRVVEQLIELKEISLLLPKTVIEEFDRNKERIIKTSGQSFSETIKRARQIIDTLGAADTKDTILRH